MRIIFSLLFIFILFFTSCGRKGKPLPPYSKTPMHITNIFSKQQGNNIFVIWNYNPTYDDGRPLKEFSFIVYKNDKPLNIEIHKAGNLYWFKHPIEDFNKEYCFYIVVKSKNKLSEPSKLTCIMPNRNFPPEPKLYSIKLREEGLELNWSADGDTVYIYKGNRDLILPIPKKKVENAGKYLDKSVALNKEYCYYITSSYTNSPESNPSNKLCKTFKDIFPPEPPYDFKMIKRREGYYLIWSESPSKDVIGYIIYKNGKPLFDIPIKTYYFIDKEYRPGDVYYIVAVDRAGNKSKKVYLEEIVE